MKAHRLGGNFVMDVHLAVTAIQTGAVLVTRDKDFLKLPHLNVVDPLSNEN
jgi:predicted nucleic acid-binding protein